MQWHHNVVVDKCIRYGEQQNGMLKKAVMTTMFIILIDLVVLVSGLLVCAETALNLVKYLAGMQTNILPKSCALPPYKTFVQAISYITIVNVVLALGYHYALYHYAGCYAWLYVTLSAWWCNGLHPLGMRQVQEHYFVRKGAYPRNTRILTSSQAHKLTISQAHKLTSSQAYKLTHSYDLLMHSLEVDQPTYSIYTSVSLLCLHDGLHVEHHDFPTIPWNRLPELRRIAPEFYDTLYSHKSYVQVLIDFLTTPGIPLSVLFEDSVLTPEAAAAAAGKFSS